MFDVMRPTMLYPPPKRNEFFQHIRERKNSSGALRKHPAAIYYDLPALLTASANHFKIAR